MPVSQARPTQWLSRAVAATGAIVCAVPLLDPTLPLAVAAALDGVTRLLLVLILASMGAGITVLLNQAFARSLAWAGGGALPCLLMGGVLVATDHRLTVVALMLACYGAYRGLVIQQMPHRATVRGLGAGLTGGALIWLGLVVTHAPVVPLAPPDRALMAVSYIVGGGVAMLLLVSHLYDWVQRQPIHPRHHRVRMGRHHAKRSTSLERS